MNTKLYRILSLLLICLMIVPLAAACSGDSDTNSSANTQNDGGNSPETTAGEVVDPNSVLDVPDMDFDGEDFMIAYIYWALYNGNIISDEETGDGYTEPDGDAEYYDPSDEPEAGDESDRALSYGWATWPGIGNGMLSWPVDCYVLSSLYGPRVHPVTGEYRNHGGIDFCADYGQNIYAAGSGKVVIANSSDSWGGGYGYYVTIQHDNGLTTLYAHCSSITVTEGEYVSAGQTIGYVGSTGLSTGPHLHFEVYDGGRQDPEKYL